MEIGQIVLFHIIIEYKDAEPGKDEETPGERVKSVIPSITPSQGTLGGHREAACTL